MKKGFNCGLLLLVVYRLHDSLGDDDYTFTTAVYKDETSPKPTTIYRRINVPQSQGTNHTPLDLFSFRAGELRRTQSNIWNWDYWCQLQPKKGSGSQELQRYYYDTQIDQCLTFTYSGSKGNKNKFDTVGDCERYCKGAAYTSIQDDSKLSFCSLQPHSGLCIGMFQEYYYDLNEGRCKTFLYGGCGGNQNRFSSDNECMSSCRPGNSNIDDLY